MPDAGGDLRSANDREGLVATDGADLIGTARREARAAVLAMDRTDSDAEGDGAPRAIVHADQAPVDGAHAILSTLDGVSRPRLATELRSLFEETVRGLPGLTAADRRDLATDLVIAAHELFTNLQRHARLDAAGRLLATSVRAIVLAVRATDGAGGRPGLRR